VWWNHHCLRTWDKAFSLEFACPTIYKSTGCCWIVSLSPHIEKSWHIISSRIGQFNSIYSQDFGRISDQFLIRNFRNSIRTPFVFDKESPWTWSSADFGRVVPVPGLSHWDKPLGQAQPVPVGQADWDKLCLFQWDKHRLSQLGRYLSLSHGTSHIPTLETFPCPVTSSIPTMEVVPVPLVPSCPTKWVYKAVQSFPSFFVRTRFSK